ncbi:MAG: low-specificity L-threonine aldolase [Nitrospirae bacterium]|nr:low-specificity L-threonine aldolase [Nitrospirota bacterium]
MIDLRSDTVTQPTDMMREAMSCAPVGDDVYGEDPTVNRMQEIAAALLGKTAALYVPSGIMANQLSIRAQTQPGDEVIIESSAHIVLYEHGAAAALAGAQLHGITGDRGILEPEQVEAAIQPKDPYHARTSLICLENTHNSGGGSIYPLAKIERTRSIAQAHGIAMHLDGARLFNAVVATGIPAAEYARHFDTVSFCLSKGLGAPVGSLIVTNDGPIIEQLRRSRRMYGGGMRQAGILAAAGIYALERNIPRLKEDHDNARRLAELLNKVAAVSVDVNHVETNIVIFDVVGSSRSASEIVDALRNHGVLLNAVGKTTFRAVTHLGVDAQEIEQAGQILFQVLS